MQLQMYEKCVKSHFKIHDNYLRNIQLGAAINSREWAIINAVQMTVAGLAMRRHDRSQYENDIVQYVVWVIEVALRQVRQFSESFHVKAHRSKYVTDEAW